MTQNQHQPTLLEQATLEDSEIAEVKAEAFRKHGDVLLAPIWERTIANAATRKAFEVLEQWLREQAKTEAANGRGGMIGASRARTLNKSADMLHAQLHPGEAGK